MTGNEMEIAASMVVNIVSIALGVKNTKTTVQNASRSIKELLLCWIKSAQFALRIGFWRRSEANFGTFDNAKFAL